MNNPKRKPEFHLILASLIATGAGVGKLPIAPGTWASIVAIPVASLLYILGGTWLLSVTIFLGFVIGIFVSSYQAQKLDDNDPSEVVIDEFIGMWLSILPIASDWRYYIIAILLFRFADIFKPWPCKAVERLPGGLGIMMDDIIAGLYAGILVSVIAVWFGTSPNIPILESILE